MNFNINHNCMSIQVRSVAAPPWHIQEFLWLRQVMDLGVALKLLRDVGNDEAQEAAARALVLFAVDDCNKAVIAAAGSVPLLVDLVEHGSVGAKEQACWALTNLAVNPCLRRVIAEASGVETLLLAVVEDDGSDLCQAMAAAALANMAWDDDTAAIIMGMGAIDALVDLERSGSALVKEMVAWALGNLACSSPDVRLALAGAGAIPPLIELLRSGTYGARARAGRPPAVLSSHMADEKGVLARALEGLGARAAVSALVPAVWVPPWVPTRKPAAGAALGGLPSVASLGASWPLTTTRAGSKTWVSSQVRAAAPRRTSAARARTQNSASSNSDKSRRAEQSRRRARTQGHSPNVMWIVNTRARSPSSCSALQKPPPPPPIQNEAQGLRALQRTLSVLDELRMQPVEVARSARFMPVRRLGVRTT